MKFTVIVKPVGKDPHQDKEMADFILARRLHMLLQRELSDCQLDEFSWSNCITFNTNDDGKKAEAIIALEAIIDQYGTVSRNDAQNDSALVLTIDTKAAKKLFNDSSTATATAQLHLHSKDNEARRMKRFSEAVVVFDKVNDGNLLSVANKLMELFPLYYSIYNKSICLEDKQKLVDADAIEKILLAEISAETEPCKGYGEMADFTLPLEKEQARRISNDEELSNLSERVILAIKDIDRKRIAVAIPPLIPPREPKRL